MPLYKFIRFSILFLLVVACRETSAPVTAFPSPPIQQTNEVEAEVVQVTAGIFTATPSPQSNGGTGTMITVTGNSENVPTLPAFPTTPQPTATVTPMPPTMTAVPPTTTPIPQPSTTAAPAQTRFNCERIAEMSSSECEALVALYLSTNGDQWLNRNGWLATDTPCQWEGIICWEGQVVSIYLVGNNLVGEMPAQIGDLTHLRALILAGNWLSGTLPATIGQLSQLEELILGNNQFSGNIPLALAALSQLKVLALEANQFSGEMPAFLDTLTHLNTISLANNQNLVGPLPHTLIQFGTSIQIYYTGTNLCEPTDDAFQAWLNSFNIIQERFPCDDRLDVANNSAIINQFVADRTYADGGDTITLSWNVANAVEVDIEIGTPYLFTPPPDWRYERHNGLENAGTLTYQITERTCVPQLIITLYAKDTPYVEPRTKSLEITLPTRTALIAHVPDIPPCPAKAGFISTIVEQPFEHGTMIWIAETGKIFVLFNDQAHSVWFRDDTYNPQTDPAFDDTLFPPAGLFQPQFGIGKAWREDEQLRYQPIGWATAPEQSFTAPYQGHFSGERLSASSISVFGGLDGFLWRIDSGYGAPHWTKTTIPTYP